MSNPPRWLRTGAVRNQVSGSTLLFVCTGNICRSAFAAAALRARVGDRADTCVVSAGIRAMQGWPMDPGMARAGAELGLALGGHEARQVTGRMIANTAAVVVFGPEHHAWMRQEFPEHMGRVVAIGQVARGLGTLPRSGRLPLAHVVEAVTSDAPRIVDADWIDDPYGHDDSVKMICAKRILADVDILATRVDWED